MIATLPAPVVDRFRSDCAAPSEDESARLGVAVSGGPDSLALLLLACAAFPGRVAAATVDHGLRPESAGEARFVGTVCADLSVAHSVLAVDVDPRRSSRQRAAREARYRALAGWCDAGSIGWLATAHHLDDQAETLMMRLLRGSGVGGLAGVRASAPLPGSAARLVRPLLGWRKTELEALVAAAGLNPVSDPSNADERYDRARMRRRLSETPWIDPMPLARSASALAEAELALDWAAERAWRERVAETDGVIGLDPDGLPAEIVRRLLVRLIGSQGAVPRGEEIQRLAEVLGDGKTATLGGYRCTGGKSWRFEREAPRAQLIEETKA